MAGVSDTPGFVADLGPPKWQVYQITRLIIHARDITKKTMCVEQLVYVTSRYFKQLPLKQGSTSGCSTSGAAF